MKPVELAEPKIMMNRTEDFIYDQATSPKSTLFDEADECRP